MIQLLNFKNSDIIVQSAAFVDAKPKALLFASHNEFVLHEQQDFEYPTTDN